MHKVYADDFLCQNVDFGCFRREYPVISVERGHLAD